MKGRKALQAGPRYKPVSSPRATGSSVDAVTPKTLVARQGDPVSVREFAGYALAFSALAALLAGTPQQVSAANYTTGTHQTTVANSQSPGFVRGTTPALIPVSASPVIGGTHVASPEQIDSGYARVYHYTPPAVVLDLRQPYTFVSAPEQIDSGYSIVYGRQPDGIDRPIGITRAAAPEQVDSGQAYQYRYTPPAVAATDVRPPFTRVVAPEQVDTASAHVFTPAVDLIPPPQIVGGVNYTVGTHRFDDAAFVRTGRYVVPVVAGTDVAISTTRIAAPEHIDSGSYIKIGELVQPSVTGTDTPIGRLRVSAPHQIESGAAHLTGPTPEALLELAGMTRSFSIGQDSTEQWGGRVWGIARVTVAGTDVPPPKTLRSAPQQIDTAASWIFRPSADLIPPPAVAQIIGKTRVSAPEQIDSGYAFITGPQPSDLIGIFRSVYAEQESTEQSGGSVWGTFVAAPLGTDKPIGHFTAYFEPFYQPVQIGITFTPNTDLIPPPVVIPGGPDDYIVRHRHRRSRR